MHNSTQTGPTQRMLEQMQAGETEATNTTSPTLIPHQSSVPSSRATHSDHNQHHETSLLHGANTSNGAGSINASAASFRSHRQNYEDVSHIQPRDHLIQGGRDSVSSLRHQLPYGSHSPRIVLNIPDDPPGVTLDRLTSAFVSVVTRHGHNPLDPAWAKAKDLLVIAWYDMQADIAAATARSQLQRSHPHPPYSVLQPPISPAPSGPLSLVSAQYHHGAPPPSGGSLNTGAPAQSTGQFLKDPIRASSVPIVGSMPPFRPPLNSIVHILQGRVFVLSVQDIPVPGIVSITIRNYGGSLHGEDVSDNFVMTRAVRTEGSGRGSKVQWKLRSEYSTSKLPYVRKQIPQMDKQTVHSVSFTLTPSGGQPDLTLNWKKFLLVLGRGSSGEHDILKSCDLSWDELVPGAPSDLPALVQGAPTTTTTAPSSTTPTLSTTATTPQLSTTSQSTSGVLPSGPMSSMTKQKEAKNVTAEEDIEMMTSKRKRKKTEHRIGKKLRLTEDGELAIAEEETEDEEEEEEEGIEGGEKTKRTKKGSKEAMKALKTEKLEKEEYPELENEKSDKEAKRKEVEGEMEREMAGEPARDSISQGGFNIVPPNNHNNRNTDSGMDGDVDGKSEPFETFALEPRATPPQLHTTVPPRPTQPAARPGQPQTRNTTGTTTTTVNAGGGAAAQVDGGTARVENLHLSIRLLELHSKQPVPWGSLVPDDSELAIAMFNPSQDKIRVVCHVCDKEEKRLPMEGKMVLDLNSKESSVMCKFRAMGKDGPIQLHFLAAALPLVAGRPLFHTRLFINVEGVSKATEVVV